MRIISVFLLLGLWCVVSAADPVKGPQPVKRKSRPSTALYVESVEVSVQRKAQSKSPFRDWFTSKLAVGSAYKNKFESPVRVICPQVFVSYVRPDSEVLLKSVANQKSGERLGVKSGRLDILVQSNRVGVKDFIVTTPTFSANVDWGLVSFRVGKDESSVSLVWGKVIISTTGSSVELKDGQSVSCGASGFSDVKDLTLEDKDISSRWLEEVVQDQLKDTNPKYTGRAKIGIPVCSFSIVGGEELVDLSALNMGFWQSVGLTCQVDLLDLSGLRGNPLRSLLLYSVGTRGEKVLDLSPLAGAPLVNVRIIVGTMVNDFTPLKDCPLQHLEYGFTGKEAGLDALLKIKSLRRPNGL